ncbi:MAG: hypothetical protein JXQ80_12230 [Bacteroidales bacterium]|nr:hypothetical protein [Bacteroidales bacterium]
MKTQIIIETTYSALMSLISTDSLQAGSFYKVTDRGDRWLLFQAVSTNQMAPEGFRLMLCPATYAVGADAFSNNWIGVRNETKTALVNDLAIWGGKVWKNLTGDIGITDDDITLDSTNWAEIPKASFSNHEYIEMLFVCQYDWINDYVVSQFDSDGNTAFYNADHDSYNNCDITDWNWGTSGYLFFGNKVRGCYNNSNAGDIYSNTCDEYISHNYNNGGIYENHCLSISENRNNGEIYGNICGDILTNSNNESIANNLLPKNSHIRNNSNAGAIAQNKNNGSIEQNSHLGAILHNLNNGDIINVSSTDPISVFYNVNNGMISGFKTNNVEDTTVDKV